MSKLDTLNFTRVWGDVGQLKGYLSGLQMRIHSDKLSVEKSDVSNLQKIVARLEKNLDMALYGEEIYVDTEPKDSKEALEEQLREEREDYG